MLRAREDVLQQELQAVTLDLASATSDLSRLVVKSAPAAAAGAHPCALRAAESCTSVLVLEDEATSRALASPRSTRIQTQAQEQQAMLESARYFYGYQHHRIRRAAAPPAVFQEMCLPSPTLNHLNHLYHH